MKKIYFLCLNLSAILLLLASTANAFCGFYVGKADTKLFNEASKVVITRHDNKTVVSMINDYKGELKEFALVVPVPTVLKKGQVNVGEKAVFDHLDAYTAPRLVEYFDEDPCNRIMYEKRMRLSSLELTQQSAMKKNKNFYGVKVQEEYTVGEYDIIILSAKESDGLERWLKENDYNIPDGASKALRPYINQDMNFFVAKVNLEEKAKKGLSYLRPLQFAYEDSRFMLPIRLGMLNSNGMQDLIVFLLTKNGRVQTTNYRTVKLPANVEIPPYIKEKDEFANFYKGMFETQAKKEDYKVVFNEYFWDMGWCDPCAADPLSEKELKSLGVFWLGDSQPERTPPWGIQPKQRRIMPPKAAPVKVTRLHLRYNNESFPEDLKFEETNDTQNFQARYVLRHPWKGDFNKCDASKAYKTKLSRRQEKEIQTLANLTNWDIKDIREKAEIVEMTKEDMNNPKAWWEGVWQ